MDLTEFRNWLLLNTSSPASAENHFAKVKQFFLHNEKFDQSSVNAFLVNGQGKWQNTSFNIYLNALKHYAKFLKLDIEFPNYKRLNTNSKPYLTRKELDEILPKLPVVFNDALKVKAVLVLLFEGGLRPKEVITLKRSDIDLEKKIVVLRNTKTKKDRQIPLSDSLVKILDDYFTTQPEISNAFNLSYFTLKYIFDKLNEWFGLKNRITPYSCRHSMAHNLLKNGINLSSLQLKLGHSSILTTMNYLKVNDQEATDEMREILNKKRRGK
jgi:integrase/recombinase XerD